MSWKIMEDHEMQWTIMDYHGMSLNIMEYHEISWIIMLGKHPKGPKTQILARRLSRGYPDLRLMGGTLRNDLGIHMITE